MDLQKFLRPPIYILRLFSFEVLLSMPGHVADGEWWLTAVVVKKSQNRQLCQFPTTHSPPILGKMDPLSPAQPPRKSHSFPDCFSTSQAAPRFRERPFGSDILRNLDAIMSQLRKRSNNVLLMHFMCYLHIRHIFWELRRCQADGNASPRLWVCDPRCYGGGHFPGWGQISQEIEF